MPTPRSKCRFRCLNRKNARKTSFSSIKSACSPINTGASSSSFNSNCSASNRLSKVRILKDGEAASIKYFTNAQGQQVFKSEPKPDQYLPSQSELGTGFIAWLKTNFGWLYAQAQVDASLGSAYMYADGQLPSWAVLGEYDNGSASGTGRTEYIWLPTEDGGTVPVGMFRNNKFFAIHTDHSGTPRLMTDSLNKPVWQWPYSAFGNNKPTGVLKPTTSGMGAFTNQPNLLATQTPAAVLDLRFPGQMADEETGLFYNYFRSYQPGQGRYTQNDPIGLAGGLNRYAYFDGSPLMFTDPLGLQSMPGGVSPRGITPNLNPQNRLPSGAPAPAVNQVIGGTTDFMRNYIDMRNANTIGADKYFHCRANCQASRRGSAGESVACKLSDGREWFDQAIKGDPTSASEADQAANTFGRSHAGTSGSCDVVCGIYRPNGLSPRY